MVPFAKGTIDLDKSTNGKSGSKDSVVLVTRIGACLSSDPRAMGNSSAAGDRAIRAGVQGIRFVLVFICLMSWMLCLGCALPPPPAAAPALPTAAQAGATTVVAVAAPAPPATTLPQFLGINGLFGGMRTIGQRVRNRLGSRFPGLESKPPVLAITDPANMSEDASPAVKAAAEAKAEEDQAPQKAKAIRYLASLGCGKCYPDTEDALLAALEDCNEMIRYETVQGLRKSAGDPCQCCRENSCCSPKLLKKLYDMAYETSASGCYLESSARVRRVARLVIRGCGGVPTDVETGPPEEGPSSLEQSSGPSVVTTSMTSDELELPTDLVGSGVITASEPPINLESNDDVARRP